MCKRCFQPVKFLFHVSTVLLSSHSVCPPSAPLCLMLQGVPRCTGAPCDTDGRRKRRRTRKRRRRWWGRPERVGWSSHFHITPDPGHPGAELHCKSSSFGRLLWIVLVAPSWRVCRPVRSVRPFYSNQCKSKTLFSFVFFDCRDIPRIPRRRFRRI